MELIHSEDREEFKRQLSWNSTLPQDKSSMSLHELMMPGMLTSFICFPVVLRLLREYFAHMHDVYFASDARFQDTWYIYLVIFNEYIFKKLMILGTYCSGINL